MNPLGSIKYNKTSSNKSKNEIRVLISAQMAHAQLQDSDVCVPTSVSRFVTMDGLMERLERAVTRLEQMSVTMQSSGMANGDCVNNISEGKSVIWTWLRSLGVQKK